MKGDLTYRTGEYSIGSWGTQSTIPNDSVELSFTRSTGKSSFMAGITVSPLT